MNWRTFLILLWLLAYCALGMAAYDGAPHSWPLAFGCACGAVGLIAAWGVFGGAPFSLRASSALAVVLGLSWVVSTMPLGWQPSARCTFEFMLSLLTAEVLTAVMGLTLLWCCGLRLHTDETQHSSNEAVRRRCSQFSIAALLAVVGCAAAVMGAARWAISLDSAALDYMGIGVMLGCSVVPSIVMVWLRGYVALRCLAGAALVAVLVLGVFFSDFRVANWLIVDPSTLLFVTASLAVFRVCGCRLEWTPKARRVENIGMTSTRDVAASPFMPAESRL